MSHQVPPEAGDARLREDRLLAFCTDQFRHFDAGSWLTVDFVDAPLLATAARFLAEMGWYGHRADLLRVVERLAPESEGSFSRLAQRTEFEPARFGAMLLRQLEHHGLVA